MRLRRIVEAVPVVAAVTAALLAAGCTTDGGVRVTPTGLSAGRVTPEVSLTPIDPGPPPVVTVPPPVAGEVARVVVTKQGSGKAFRNVPGVPVAEGHTYTVEVACAAGRATEGSSYAVYDAAPGTWGHGEPLYSRPFACDGAVQRTVHLGLPSGRVQIDVRGLPADAVTAYALIRPE
ncbi:hypothetical protein [Terracoccus sp. 273MFTsu3.1]|uniref:hypothetical protein n=1 Tax=Terracoccus sp. 273MFTsu3.1 TaxID=1172188 RepID=UPI00036952F1|nr:hypothetical protein [Terracoccus sp. 273MFTsu3.1]